MDSCVVCGGVEFYTESGFYFCQQCETQQEGRREEVVEYAADASTHVTKKKINRRSKLPDEKEISLSWTSWETFNFILNGWTNELILLGASPEFKITVLQLWATYLGKLEVAFRSFSNKCLPRLPLFCRKKDSEIVFGPQSKEPSRVKKRKRAPSSATSDGESTHVSDLSFGRLLSQRRKKLVDLEYQKYLDTSESETDGASSINQSLYSIKSDALQPKKRTVPIYLNSLAQASKNKARESSKKYSMDKRANARLGKLNAHRSSVEHLTMQDVLAVVNLALRIDDEKIHLSDLLRFQVEGHMSIKKMDHFFPDEDPIPSDLKRTVFTENKYEGIREATGNLAHLLGVSQIPEPNIVELIRRYCADLQLPKGIALYTERMIAMSPPKLTFEKRNTSLPRYEAKVMSAIIIVMKILFGLDGVTEYEISRAVERINLIAEKKDALDSKLFSFVEWQRYIECRRSVIISQHSATKHRLDPEAPSQNVDQYVNYLSKFMTPGDPKALLKSLTENIDKNMKDLAENLPEPEPVRSFQPSLTPMHSYLQELLVNDEVDLPSILRQDFSSMKIGYMTDTKIFRELGKECGIDLEIIDSSVNFLERIVPIFDLALHYSPTDDLSKPTPVTVPKKTIERQDDPLEYLHLKNTGKIVIDKRKRSLYCKNLERSKRTKKQTENDFDDFVFDEVLSNGKLKIAEFDDSDSEDDDSQVFSDENLLLSNYERQSLKGRVKSHWHLAKTREKKAPRKVTENCDCIMCLMKDSPSDDSTPKKPEDRPSTSKNKKNEEDSKGEDDDNDLSIIEELPRITLNDENDEISILSEKGNASRSNKVTTFRPYKDYWLYRRKATPDKGTHVEWHRLERDLPVNFRWLLNECAGMIEMEGGVLYQELAVMEAYYADCIVENYDLERANKFYDVVKHRDKGLVSTIRKKWKNEYKRVRKV